MIPLIVLCAFILTSCAVKGPKLSGINYIDIVQTDGGISISYYRENPLEEERTVSEKRPEPPACEKGESLWAIWVWDVRELERNWVKFKRVVNEWGIKRVYLQLSRHLTQDHIDRLRGMGLEVFLLDGGRTTELNFSLDYVRSFEADGFQIDIEPYINPDFNLKRESYLKSYVKLLSEVRRKLRGRRFSVVIPFWLDKLSYGGKPVLEHVFRYADEVVIMAYRNNLSSSLSLSVEEIAQGGRFGKPVLIGFELHRQKDEKHNIYRVEKRSLIFVGSYEVKGEELSMTLEELRRIRGIKCKGVYGFVIHSFEAL